MMLDILSDVPPIAYFYAGMLSAMVFGLMKLSAMLQAYGVSS